MLSDRRLGAIRGSTDTEVLFGLVLDRLDAGLGQAEALTSVIRTVAAVAGGRMNLLLADGRRIAATAYGDSLSVCEGGTRGPEARVVASEPFDDDPAWRAVPEGSVVEVGDGGIAVRPMEGTRPVVRTERTGGTA
jgi:glutamine amidotransferase